jgi:replicative DNA helicase
VIVDYFRLIEEVALDGGAATRQEQVSKKLKEIAKCYDCHVMSIFDMNKEGQRETIPSALAMKGGSAAQYDADIIMTMAWDESMKVQGAYYAPEGEAHIVLRTIKNRDGEQGRVDLYINLATGYVKEWR